MKKITNKTLLKQGDVIYQSIMTDIGVIGWYDKDGYLVAQSGIETSSLPFISLWDFQLIKPTEYTLEDIVKAIELARILIDGKHEFDVDNILGSSDGTHGIEQKYTSKQIIKQINSVSMIEVDEQFNIISYE